MKTAISLPDELFQRADRMAKRCRLSRSELYAQALARYLDEVDDEAITAKLDELYRDGDGPLDEVVAELQRRSIDEW